MRARELGAIAALLVGIAGCAQLVGDVDPFQVIVVEDGGIGDGFDSAVNDIDGAQNGDAASNGVDGSIPIDAADASVSDGSPVFEAAAGYCATLDAGAGTTILFCNDFDESLDASTNWSSQTGAPTLSTTTYVSAPAAAKLAAGTSLIESFSQGLDASANETHRFRAKISGINAGNIELYGTDYGGGHAAIAVQNGVFVCQTFAQASSFPVDASVAPAGGFRSFSLVLAAGTAKCLIDLYEVDVPRAIQAPPDKITVGPGSATADGGLSMIVDNVVLTSP